MTVRDRLYALRDEEYRLFQCKLMPTVPPEKVLGVRMPVLRRLARDLKGDDQAETFLTALPHDYYDEYNLHALLLESTRDFKVCVQAVDALLPYVDNWATCDLLAPRVFGRYKADLLPHIRRWMASCAPYTVRFGIGMLMRHYLKEDFDPSYLSEVAFTVSSAAPSAISEAYYVRMMVAWYFATALAYRYDEVIGYLEDKSLPQWTHNKVIRKGLESYRIAPERKSYLRSLRW